MSDEKQLIDFTIDIDELGRSGMKWENLKLYGNDRYDVGVKPLDAIYLGDASYTPDEDITIKFDVMPWKSGGVFGQSLSEKR